MKRALLVASVGFLVSAALAYVGWSRNMLPIPGGYGESWRRSMDAVELVWYVIEAGVVSSFVTAIAFAVWQPRAPKSTMIAMSLLLLDASFAAWVIFAMRHLNIQ